MKVFVGYDKKEHDAYEVCKHSILKYHPDAQVISIVQQHLRDIGVYWREVDSLGSTEFTFTRFLVPALMNFQGWAIFCDCDFLWTADIQELFDLRDDKYAVMVVKHDYTPSNKTKMDDQHQHLYPRKNWSSMVLWNCSHPSNRQLTPDLVNSASGQFLHRFQWLPDDHIGELDKEWNWLVNWYTATDSNIPKAIHFTEGGPWLAEYSTCEYSNLWNNEYLMLTLQKNTV